MDGAFSPSTGTKGGEGILCDDNGKIIRGFSSSFTPHSGLQAELRAVLIGLKAAKARSVSIWIEVDAKEVVNSLDKEQHGAANDRHLIVEIKNLLKGSSFEISHIRREGNKIAHWLAKHGATGSGATMFEELTAPSFVKAMAVLDQLGLPNLRRNNDDKPP